MGRFANESVLRPPASDRPRGRTAQASELRVRGRAVLDRAAERLRGGHVDFGMESLRADLEQLRSSTAQAEWDHFVATDMARHPALALVLQSPFTRRALKKPRGYAGDAVMLDYVYGMAELPEDTSPLGRAIYRWEFQAQTCCSVRARRELLTDYLEAVAAERTRPRILSVACGHLREAEHSIAVMEDRIGALFALDQDAESLAVVETTHEQREIHTVRQSAIGLIRGKTTYSDLDFVYVSGLYDYLSAPLATALTNVLFDFLAPGGRLLLANFTSDLRDIGYMEGFMDWRLIYRSESDLEALACELPESSIESRRTFRESTGTIAFLEILKR